MNLLVTGSGAFGSSGRVVLQSALYDGWTIAEYREAGDTFHAILSGNDWASERAEYQVGRLQSFMWGVSRQEGTAVAIKYLPVNQAYLVLWHEERLAGPMPLPEARYWCQERGIAAVEL